MKDILKSASPFLAPGSSRRSQILGGLLESEQSAMPIAKSNPVPFRRAKEGRDG